MNRRLFRKWALWLLPLLVARAFLPVGFMLSANAGDLELVFCAGQAPALAQALKSAAATDHSAHGVDHSQHHMPQALGSAGEHSSHQTQLDPPCPYALAAVAITAEVPYLHSDTLWLTDESSEAREQLPATAGPERADRIRGPPSLS